MDEPTILRETKIGQKGFVKEDVMTYLDELNSKIVSLEGELKSAKVTGPADPQELTKYRNQVDSLQEKLNASNNALRSSKKEIEELKKQHEDDQKLISQLKAGGSGAVAAAAQSNAQTAAALEAAKKEIDKLKSQLKDAESKATSAPAAQPNVQQNPQTAAALEAAKKEIDKLRSQLKTAEQKPAAPAPVANAVNNEELEKTKQELAKIKSELETKSKEISEKDSKIDKLTKDNVAAIAQKDAEIVKLNSEITTLKESASDPTAQMGLLFAEAQKTVNSLKTQAKIDADKATAEAQEKAEKILNEANETAEKTIANANTTAEICIKEANDQAKLTVENANSHADKVNQMSSTVRTMLLNEIESVNTKFNDITSVLNRLTSQAGDRMSEAQLIIGEARKAVSKNESEDVKKMEAPKANFKASEAPKAAMSDLGTPSQKMASKSADPFAEIGSAESYQKKNSGYNNTVNSHNKNNAPSQPEQPKQPQPAKKNNFSFDMAELLKAAEEEAAKNPEA